MGKRGPKPTPTSILKLVGSSIPGRSRHDEPQPPQGSPDKPEWITDETSDVWDQVTAHLADMKVLTVADGNAIARYSEMFVRWIHAANYLRENEETYEDEKGIRRHVPEVKTVHHLAVLLLQIEREFGLTPSSRASIKVEPGSKPNAVSSRTRNA